MSGFFNETGGKLCPFVLTALTAALITINAQAAVLSGFEGDVSVNRGNGFRPVSLGATLNPGYRLRTGEGVATIRYDNGCSTKVAAHQTVVVSSQPPVCEGAGEAQATPVQEYGVATVAETEPLILGGVIAGATGLAVALANSGNGGSEIRGVSP